VALVIAVGGIGEFTSHGPVSNNCPPKVRFPDKFPEAAEIPPLPV
jgi:hypothetical protein